jgi:poly(3-hydroxybutyrate) depolymerase
MRSITRASILARTFLLPLFSCRLCLSRTQDRRSGWSRLADREGFIVYPEGIGILGFLQHWNAGHCCGKAVEDNWNDVAFIEAAIDGTCRQYAVDKRRIYMIGFSNGGMMTYRFAAERSSLLAAAASVSGARRATFDTSWSWSRGFTKGALPL